MSQNMCVRTFIGVRGKAWTPMSQNMGVRTFIDVQIGTIINQWLLAQQLAERNLIPDEIPTEASTFVVALLSTPGGFEYWEHDSKATLRGNELLDMARQGIGEQPNILDILPWFKAADDE